MSAGWRKWDRVKAVRCRPGQQCLYEQRYGTVMEVYGGGLCLVALDGYCSAFYDADQLDPAEPQAELLPPVISIFGSGIRR